MRYVKLHISTLRNAHKVITLYREKHRRKNMEGSRKGKVTLQTIADKLQVSRNTVSKALNDHADVAEETKQLIYNTAVELGYKKIGILQKKELHIQKQREEEARKDMNRSIAFLSYGLQVEGSYWSHILKGIEAVAREDGYNIILGSISPEDEEQLILPNCVTNGSIEGIVLMGSLNQDYVQKVIKSQIPTVLIDTYAEKYHDRFGADIIMVNNEESTRKLTEHLISQGIEDIGFIGDITYSKSFQERWEGYLGAMNGAGLTINRDYCIIHKEAFHYQHKEAIEEEVQRMTKLPRGLVCANDRIAINVIRALKARGVSVPEDVAIVGFDDIDEAKIIEPSLTTVNISKGDLGRRTMDELLWRIKHPDYPYEVVRMMTTLQIRNSSRI